MLGYTITYKPYDSGARTLLNHTLFGRIVYKNYRGRKYAYYDSGMLDNTRFARLITSKIFVESMSTINVDVLEAMAVIDVKQTIRDESTMNLATGREYWERIAEERGVPVRVGGKRGKGKGRGKRCQKTE